MNTSRWPPRVGQSRTSGQASRALVRRESDVGPADERLERLSTKHEVVRVSPSDYWKKEKPIKEEIRERLFLQRKTAAIYC